jgi:hypothetical protein
MIATLISAICGGSADAQVIRCENFVLAEERIACYYYRASVAPGRSCLFVCPPKAQKPSKRARHRRTRH